MLLRVLFGAALVAALVVGGTAFRVWQVARTEDRSKADIVVVLGAAQYNGRPTPVLEARLEHARALYRRGVAQQIVTVGGGLPGDNFTEGEAGRRWLIDHDVPAANVTAVGEGGDTLGSMKAVAAVARDRGWRTAVIVSDPWHSLRARTMARDAGLDSWTSPTRHGPIVQTRETQGRYIIRETGALLYYRLTHAPAGDNSTSLD
ncbi:YdcF family protein [Streptoalloteichus hindustanus]|uniref:Uncharacterized SAM-binding protein YcdF, DUF218 family n=1 Tax=Streptoalloteichus hindustanus TaxID=2017 RepID=A0A1M5BGX4_STRHI|nr:YdcF family protein [Streptoalloteichus hindustanus]SHF41728.1 Uncharacterized SAM-binding protein YcdF, DUF218 family [Streptoalloteichus hindustanus]